MIYIDIEENRKIDIKKSFVKRIFFNISNKIHKKSTKFIEEKKEDKILLTLPNIENKTLNKLSKYINKNCISSICASDNLRTNPIFMEYLKNEKIKNYDGKWIFKIMATKVVKYIVENKKEKMEYQEISILSNKIDDIVVYTIRSLVENVKIVNILTDTPYKFRKLEKELYDQKGIIINMNNNYKKSLQKSDIILNFDFTEDEINKYTLPPKACIVNFNEYVNIGLKSFEGINACFFEMSMPKKYFKYLLDFKNYNIPILYESLIYKNTNPINIVNEIESDEVNITFLTGKNGKIRKNEYLKMTKKLVN